MSSIYLDTTTRYRAYRLAPWAARIARVDGGYLAFATVDAYRQWRRQR